MRFQNHFMKLNLLSILRTLISKTPLEQKNYWQTSWDKQTGLSKSLVWLLLNLKGSGMFHCRRWIKKTYSQTSNIYYIYSYIFNLVTHLSKFVRFSSFSVLCPVLFVSPPVLLSLLSYLSYANAVLLSPGWDCAAKGKPGFGLLGSEFRGR